MKEVDIEDEFDEKWAEMSEQEKDRSCKGQQKGDCDKRSEE